MTNPIEYFMSVDITMSDKLLEVLYFVIGLVTLYVAFRNLQDKENKKRYGSFIFWFLLGLMFVIGPWIPPLYTGILMVLMVLSPILKQVGVGSEPARGNREKLQKNWYENFYTCIINRCMCSSLCFGNSNFSFSRYGCWCISSLYNAIGLF